MPPAEQKPVLGQFEQVVEKLKSSNNILVTISTNPTVDQFAACIGVTLILNKLGKHATAVFSGAVPSTIDFLQPEKTIEKNTDSLRDFIIALDKSKADKLRYKVENDVVKIFITPYKTSISEKDLEYSQGDFNVDAVLALGIQDKTHIDAAILAHGRILHDATVLTVGNNAAGGKLGAINWFDGKASSLCEMATDIAMELSREVLDQQNATALLTGIVAETDRYKNEKASPHTMSIAGVLMSAGASTQLVSSKLDAQKEEMLPKLEIPAKQEAPKEAPKEDGVIEIQHGPATKAKSSDTDEIVEQIGEADDFEIEIDEQGNIKKPAEAEPATEEPEQNEQPPQAPDSSQQTTSSLAQPRGRLVVEPPSLGGTLTANSQPTDGSSSLDMLSGNESPTKVSSVPLAPSAEATSAPTIGPAKAGGSLAPQNQTGFSTDGEEQKDQTLTEIEKIIGSPHTKWQEDQQSPDSTPAAAPTPTVEQARKAVENAEGEERPVARQDLGTKSFNDEQPPSTTSSPAPPVPPPFVPGT